MATYAPTSPPVVAFYDVAWEQNNNKAANIQNSCLHQTIIPDHEGSK